MSVSLYELDGKSPDVLKALTVNLFWRFPRSGLVNVVLKPMECFVPLEYSAVRFSARPNKFGHRIPKTWKEKKDQTNSSNNFAMFEALHGVESKKEL